MIEKKVGIGAQEVVIFHPEASCAEEMFFRSVRVSCARGHLCQDGENPKSFTR